MATSRLLIPLVLVIGCASFTSVTGVAVSATLSSSSVTLGGNVAVSVSLASPAPTATVVWPFVNGSQWGAYCNITSGASHCTLLLPFPYAGLAQVQVAVLAAPPNTPYPVGQPLSGQDVEAVSSSMAVTVAHAFVGSASVDVAGSMVLMEWEPWFTPSNWHWTLNEAVPIVGKYDSFNEGVVKQHCLWMRGAGVGGIVVDWTNNLWGKSSWADRGVYAQELINATTFTIALYDTWRKDPTAAGFLPPQVVLLMGLDNGASEKMAVLNQQIAWVAANYLANFSADNWVTVDGKPLLVIFDGGNLHSHETPVSAPQFTVRWMSTQLQRDTALAASGYWSWMDGSRVPVVSTSDSKDVAMTVTPAYFSDGGWLAAQAKARHGGSTFVTQLQFALDVQPPFIVVCQWNEFAGTRESPSVTSYADSFNVSLSNDIEPTSLTDCGYIRPDDRSCGGWGFRYLNVLSAATYLLANPSADVTIITISTPVPSSRHGTHDALSVQWEVLGKPPAGFVVTIGQVVVARVMEPHARSVQVVPSDHDLSPGTYTVTVQCASCKTTWQPSPTLWYSQPSSQASPAIGSTHVSLFASSGPPPPDVYSQAVGFVTLPSSAASPAVLLLGDIYHAWFTSAGSASAASIAHTESKDGGLTWSSPSIAVKPSAPYSTSGVSDPSVIRFRGVFIMYFTCVSRKQPPDGYTNHRVCAALSDAVTGPWRPYPTPVLQHTACGHESGIYCVGQPSAVMQGGQVYLYASFSNSSANAATVLLATSTDGLMFAKRMQPSGAPLFSHANVDVAVNRNDGRFFLVQASNRSDAIAWSVSMDGITWQPYTDGHTIASNPDAAWSSGPGIATSPDGSFSGDTFLLFASPAATSSEPRLFRSNVIVAPSTNNCSHCAVSGCDYACSAVLHDADVVYGRCARPGSTNPGDCCTCQVPLAPPSCSACAPGGCVEACVAAGHAAGYCAIPGSPNSDYCCACVA